MTAAPRPDALPDDGRSHLEAAYSQEAAQLDRLIARLARAADDEGLLDLAHRYVDSPIGPLLVVLSERGLVRVAFEVEDHERVLAQLAERVSPRVLADTRRTDPAARQLEQYFDGTRTEFDLPLDLRLVTGFRREVVEQLPVIPYGQRWSYRELAAATGRPTAVRATASGCANNPVPIVVPCHRVVRSDGSVGRYLGGPEAKLALLELEALRSG